MGVSYCHTHRICVIPILINFIVEFRAVSTGRTQCFAVAAKICGDCAIWLGALGGGFNTANTLSAEVPLKVSALWFLRAGLWSGPPRAPGLCLPVCSSKGGGAGGSLGGSQCCAASGPSWPQLTRGSGRDRPLAAASAQDSPNVPLPGWWLAE